MRAAGLRRGHGRASDPPEPARAGARGAGSRGHWPARPRPRRRSRGPGPELPCAEPEVGYGGAPGLPAGWSCGRLGHSVGRPHGGCSPEKPPLGGPLRAPPGRAGTGLGCKCARESVGGRGGAVQPAAAPLYQSPRKECARWGDNRGHARGERGEPGRATPLPGFGTWVPGRLLVRVGVGVTLLIC